MSAAIALAEREIPVNLISLLPSERAQSVLAEGGINGALNTMGEEDTPSNHFYDTMQAGVQIADPQAVKGLTDHAPGILQDLKRLGVPFNLKNEQIQQRNFGGQKKKRTAYARSSTGKVLMTALIDEARKYEVRGLIRRYSHHELIKLWISSADKGKCCLGAWVLDHWTEQKQLLEGPVLMASGGMNGLFPGVTTGTLSNSGAAAALAFSQGVRFSNLEMIQYHPTTIQITGKRCLISEAARGEGGRLFVLRDGRPWYFMEEKYPELGNLMPRDVVSREMVFTGSRVCLDMRELSRETWKKKLPDLREEVKHYLGIDPAKDPVPVEPGIHYFMGGIDVDVRHRTSIPGLYAAGECCSQYHGANRLGGNSTMGAIYGGRVAAGTMAEDLEHPAAEKDHTPEPPSWKPVPDLFREQVKDILLPALGIVREDTAIQEAISGIDQMLAGITDVPEESGEYRHLMLAKGILMSAAFRKESRGAHYRKDYPLKDDDRYKGMTLARIKEAGSSQVMIDFRKQ